MHVKSSTAATWSEYLPRSHRVHAAEPLTGLNVPAGHPEQLPATPVNPALHRQSSMLPLAREESEFMGQSAHSAGSADANSGRNLPRAHNVQGCEPLPLLYVPG